MNEFASHLRNVKRGALAGFSAGALSRCMIWAGLVLALGGCGNPAGMAGAGGSGGAKQGYIAAGEREGRAGRRMAMSDSDRAVLVTGGGERIIKVELALDPASQARGLMFRRALAAGSGMLFVHDGEEVLSMWMKNTYIPLDMLFIRKNGLIAHIHENAEPFSEEIISSVKPVAAVLELNAGAVRRMGVRIGDRLRHPLLSGE
jgi:uncharacterized membrane protein (UPF0127 family)